jgi:hypothetical protein
MDDRNLFCLHIHHISMRGICPHGRSTCILRVTGLRKIIRTRSQTHPYIFISFTDLIYKPKYKFYTGGHCKQHEQKYSYVLGLDNTYALRDPSMTGSLTFARELPVVLSAGFVSTHDTFDILVLVSTL